MQRIDVIDEVKDLTLTPEHWAEYEQAAEEDYITNEEEIKAVIRRAVAISWKDSVFTLDELHGHLIRNYVKYPVPEAEVYDWLDTVVYDVWRTQKELARQAGVAMPTIVHAKIDGEQHYGIVDPAQYTDTQTGHAEIMTDVTQIVKQETTAETTPQLTVVEPLIEEPVPVVEAEVNPETEVALRQLYRSEIAAYIFDKYVTDQAAKPKFDTVYLMNLFNAPGLTAKPQDVRAVIKTMEENGYIHSYTTGKNKNRRTWWCMDSDVKTDVLAEMEEGSFQECLSMFEGTDAVA